MGTKLWNVTVCNLICDRCEQGEEVRVDGIVSKSAMYAEALRALGWEVKGRRGDKPDEAVCPACVKKDIEVKRIKRQALAVVAADRRAALDKAKADRAALMKGESPDEVP